MLSLTATTRAQRKMHDRGQTLLLAPIALLIIMILGAVTLEVGAMHLRQRQLNDLADSLANDAATVGFDIDHFRNTGELAIDPGAANGVLGGGIAISNLPTAAAAPVSVTPGAEPAVTVALSFTHEFVLGRALFGASTELTATGEAALVPSA